MSVTQHRSDIPNGLVVVSNSGWAGGGLGSSGAGLATGEGDGDGGGCFLQPIPSYGLVILQPNLFCQPGPQLFIVMAMPRLVIISFSIHGNDERRLWQSVAFGDKCLA